MISQDTVLESLEGVWSLERVIGGQATMVGNAIFERTGPGALHYRERGRVTLASGPSHEAHREYIYTALPDGFAVWFAEAEPRLFHELHLALRDGVLVGRASHLCGSDTYVTDYRFASDDAFAIAHAVTGPRKDYVSMTRFTRRS